MESLDYWRLCDSLSIFQATLLIIGEDPASNSAYVEQWAKSERPTGYEATKTALINAIKSGEIKPAEFCLEKFEDDRGYIHEMAGVIDIQNTVIDISSIKSFLLQRGITKGFFFPAENSGAEKYLNSNDPHYAPKLAAAVR